MKNIKEVIKIDKKIVQIIPAPSNLFVSFKDAEGELESKVICLALTNEGDILLMDLSADGDISDATTAINFTEAYFGE